MIPCGTLNIGKGTIMKIKIAFYKANGTIVDKLIRFWTRSKYSHCELIINGIWYTSISRKDDISKGITKRKLLPKEGHWDYIEIEGLDYNKVQDSIEFFNSQLNKKYDWLGIFLSQFIPLKIQDKDKWFCSEIDSKMLKISGFNLSLEPNQYSPGRLFEEIKQYGEFKEG